jgi:hypothetical protein
MSAWHCRGCGCTSRQLIKVPRARTTNDKRRKPEMIVRPARLALHSWPDGEHPTCQACAAGLERLRWRCEAEFGRWSWT